MEEFIVSARKYRPKTFDDVVGQLHITGTLKNAIKNQKIAHALLFCGPRGVGKTTCARIVAKTLNCYKLTADIEPCNNCDSCNGFNSSHSFNIHELDAASNNSVDDIRNLIEQVRISPQVGKYNIFIIDEVHMLSTSAFNAFLKTLEEPPPHAIFILATTEKHKILPTIISRCQVFDFQRITTEDISAHLLRIAVKEGIEIDHDAVHVIAQKAEGGLRDALSIFDRIVTFAGKQITYQTAIENLNILDYDYFFRVVDYVLAADIQQLLLIYDEILGKGFDGTAFIDGLSDHYRNLLVCIDPGTHKLLEVSENVKARFIEQAKQCKPGFLIESLKIINQTDNDYRNATNRRLCVELCLLKLAELMLRKKAENQAQVASPASVAPSPASPAPAITPAATEMKPPVPSPTPVVATTPTPAAAPAQVAQPVQPAPTPELKATPTPTAEAAQLEQSVAEPQILPTQTATNTTSQAETPAATNMAAPGAMPMKKTLSLKQVPVVKTAQEIAAEHDDKPRQPFSQAKLNQTWMAFAETLKQQGKHTWHSMLTHHQPMLLEQDVIEFTLDHKGQESELEAMKPDLLGYLRTELQNGYISIKAEVRAVDNSIKIYTAQDKYQDMVKKNPNLETLRTTLNLDLEF